MNEPSLPPVTNVSVDWPLLHPKNPRQGNVDSIVALIKANGWWGCIVVQRSTRYVIVGNHRLRAARALGMKEVPCMVVDVDDDRAWRILVADNRASDIAENDDTVLAEVLRGLATAPVGLEGTGYTDVDLAELIESLGGEKKKGDDVVPPVRPDPVSRLGEVYELGPHRLVCGDATDPRAHELVIGNAIIAAECMWTDPPYGINYVGGNHSLPAAQRRAEGQMEIQNDGAAGLPALLRDAFAAITKSLAPGAPFYIAHPAGALAIEFELAVRAAGWRHHQTLIWVKDSFVLGHTDYHYQHEPMLYGWTAGAGRSGRGQHDGSRWHGDHAQTSVFQVPRPRRNEEHPTMKPPELIEACIINSTRAGERVLDPFAGSGSTLIACARQGRFARLIEIDPRFVDVIRRRWTTYAETAGISPGTGALK